MRKFRFLSIFLASLSLLIPLSSCYEFPFDEFAGTWENDFMKLTAYNYKVTKKYLDGLMILDGVVYKYYGHDKHNELYLENKQPKEGGYVFYIWTCSVSLLENEKLVLNVYYDYISDYTGKEVTLYQTSEVVYISL